MGSIKNLKFWHLAPIALLVCGTVAEASGLICVEEPPNENDSRLVYQFTQSTGEGLFDVENDAVAGGPVRIDIGSADFDIELNDGPVELEDAILWEGMGTKLPDKIRVRVREDKNKIYQFLLEDMRATVVQGYRPIAQLKCRVLATE
ncbi:hypothetical protein SAMN05444000_13420 [Shimia gijangensis]|uniref:Uncharacterized protein n=2 Tax=Shimia gijangensis TaxID=1470563 RepID=A0A1M6T2Q3_9RHOB|nr:hypothetical protein SAMN05444000_13420 [Shimia gijangensis]